KMVFPYQYTRALWAFAPFMAIGIYGLVQRATPWKNIWIAVTLILATIFSPLPRLYTQSISWLLIRGDDAHAEVHRRIQDYFADEQAAVGKYLDTRSAAR